MQLEPYLRAHEFMRVERPAGLWDVAVEERPFLTLLGEMLGDALRAGTRVEALTLNASNVVVERDPDPEAKLEAGDYVAVSVSGPVDFGPDEAWYPLEGGRRGVLLRLDQRLHEAGARYAYVRRLPGLGSLTVFLARG